MLLEGKLNYCSFKNIINIETIIMCIIPNTCTVNILSLFYESSQISMLKMITANCEVCICWSNTVIISYMNHRDNTQNKMVYFIKVFVMVISVSKLCYFTIKMHGKSQNV